MDFKVLSMIKQKEDSIIWRPATEAGIECHRQWVGA